jgi:hypothetical protein
MFNEWMQTILTYLDLHRQLLHKEKKRLDMRVIPETFPTLEQFGGNVEMDDGTSRYDSGDKYWPAQSHLYAAMVGVENTVTKGGGA